MKRFSDFEDSLLDSKERARRIGSALINNLGKIIAAFVCLLMLAVTFAEVTFIGFLSEKFVTSVLLLLCSAYIIYFSLEDAGEKSGERTEEYEKAYERYSALRARISGDEIEELRTFAKDYSTREFEARKDTALCARGLSREDLERYLSEGRCEKKSKRHLKRIARMRTFNITVRDLLSAEKVSHRSELESPEERKLLYLLVKLIPSTVCMFFTLSVIVTAKEGLTPSDVLNGILKLSPLPLIGFKGYSAGYSYSKHSRSAWLRTKSDVIECFFSRMPKEKTEIKAHSDKVYTA